MRTSTKVAAVGLAVFTAGYAFGVVTSPEADADRSIVFVGGTGTGYVPHDPQHVGQGFRALVPDATTAVSVNYDSLANPATATPTILATVEDQPEPVTLICVSRGAQACGYTQAALPADAEVINVGNPDGRGGISRAFGFSPPEVPNTVDTTEIVAEYDGVADMPDRPWNLLATANALVGGFTPLGPHQKYADGSDEDPLQHLDEAEVTVTKNPNGTSTTRKLIPTHALPITQPVRQVEKGLTGQTRFTDALDRALRPVIDAGYSRNDKKADTSTDNDTPDKAEKSQAKADKSTDNDTDSGKDAA